MTLLDFLIEMRKEMKFNVKKVKVYDFLNYKKEKIASKLVCSYLASIRCNTDNLDFPFALFWQYSRE